MLRLTRYVSKSETRLKLVTVHWPVGRYASAAESGQSESAEPPPPRKQGGGIFWKLLGLTLAGTGGVVGYAWYDSSFKKTIEDTVPYSKDAFDLMFQYLPAYQSQDAPKPFQQLPSAIKKPEIAPAKPVAEIAKPVESKKEIAEREAREKKEKAQELLRRREAEEAAENLALETGLESLLDVVSKSVGAAAAAHNSATKAFRTHNEQLKKAMEEGSTESQWEALTDKCESQADSMWSSEQTVTVARESLDRLRRAVADGKANATTKRNKALASAEKEINRFDKELSAAVTELTRARTEAKKLSDYRDLVRSGKEQFKKELKALGSDSKSTSETNASTELNSLIAHAHRRIDQLQKELIEQQALEPIRVQAALDAVSDEDDKETSAQIADDRERSAIELETLRRAWGSEARAEFEAELRSQLARQSAAHSDHLVNVLRAQRAQLVSEFEAQLVDKVEEEKYRLQAEIAGSLARMKAVEAAVEGRAEKERAGCRARELWLACRTLLSAVKDGGSTSSSGLDKPIRICCKIGAVRDAGSEYPIVHVALGSIPPVVHRRGIYTTDALAQRFTRVRKIARRVAMIDETGGSLSRYFLSYVQSFFVFRTRPLRVDAAIDVSEMTTFALLDNAEDCLRRGDLEQAVRFVNGLRGESRRVVANWLEEARVLLETRQAAELLMAFAAANGLGSVE